MCPSTLFVILPYTVNLFPSHTHYHYHSLSNTYTSPQCAEDVNYLRKTLQVEYTDEEALEYFQNQFSEAYGGAWTTKLDWFFHSVKHM